MMSLRRAAMALMVSVSLALPSLLPRWAAAEVVVRWGNNGEVTTMDPHGAFSTANAALLGNIYETLVRLDRNLKFEPALATSWAVVAPDHYRFIIRKGVRFHDGTLMTPRDVVASLRRASLPKSPYASVTHMIKEVVPYGEDAVDVMLRGPYPVLINDIAGISILSEDWMRTHDALEPADPAHGKNGVHQHEHERHRPVPAGVAPAGQHDGAGAFPRLVGQAGAQSGPRGVPADCQRCDPGRGAAVRPA